MARRCAKWLVSGALAAAVAAAPTPASAGGMPPDTFVLLLSVPVDVVVTIGSVTTLAGTSRSLREHPPPRGWRIGSFVMGGLSAVMVATDVALAAMWAGDHLDPTVPAVCGGLAAHHAILAASNITVGAISLRRADEPPPPDPAWSFVPRPIRLTDVGGRSAPGIAFAATF